MRRLDGQQAFVTGAAGGIGSLVAGGLAALGAQVTGIDRVLCPSCHHTMVSDLCDDAALAALAADLAARRVDILANIAGMQYFGPLESQPSAAIWRGYAVNLIAPATLIGAVLPQMRRRGAGQVVNLGSVMGAINFPFFATYSSSKAGLRGLSEGLRREVAGQGIAVTHIAPRAVRTAFNNAEVNRFMALTGMAADDPAVVAQRIVRAIAAREKDVSIGVKERLFIQLNAVMPRLIDAGLAGQTAKARTMFPLPVE
ncbi:SDR family NAD(P)-dependent oxidoreductase [Novosphingobium tardum]|uniref:SDR family NAD(P)-dependent oxidoreductase n=1 Tax=Novosphingobium tardum TaxID=1538021 RepID=A0ABV8RML8_9SPHN